jgi:hypothetical protein
MADANRDQRFSLVYRLTRDDVAAFESLPREYSGRAKFAMVLGLFAAGMLAAGAEAVLGWERAQASIWREIVTVLAALAVWFVGTSAILTALRMRRVARFPLPDEDTRLVADRDAVAIDEGKGMTRYRWSDIPWVQTGAAHVFMQTVRRDVIIVPLRAFEDAATMQAFGAFADDASAAASGD